MPPPVLRTVKAGKKDIARLLAEGKEEKARIRVEQVNFWRCCAHVYGVVALLCLSYNVALVGCEEILDRLTAQGLSIVQHLIPSLVGTRCRAMVNMNWSQ